MAFIHYNNVIIGYVINVINVSTGLLSFFRFMKNMKNYNRKLQNTAVPNFFVFNNRNL